MFFREKKSQKKLTGPISFFTAKKISKLQDYIQINKKLKLFEKKRVF